MKNIMSYLIVVFSLFGFSQAHAQDCNASDLPVRLQDLTFLEVSFTNVLGQIQNTSKCNVVKISGWKQGNSVTQNQGTTACKDKYGKTYAINPGNPQYGKENLGNLGDNKLGYYFCMPGANKAEMCTHMKGTELGKEMDITYDPKTISGDGDCVCKRKGDPAAAFKSCPANEKLDALKTDNSTGCNIKDATKDKDTNVCVCIHNTNIEPKKEGDCPSEPPKQVTENVDDKDFDECFADIKGAKEACSAKGQDAINNCSKEAPEVNKNVKEAQRVMSIGLDALIAKNAGTGALEACAKMGAAGTGLIEALSLLRENCKKELSSCKTGCEGVKAYNQRETSEMINTCKEKFAAANPPKLWTEAHTTRFSTLAQQYKDSGATAEKFCKGDAQVAEGQLQGFLDELAGSVQKADICKCQLSSGSAATIGSTGKVNTETCESILSPLTCMQNLNQPGCSFSSVGCSPGSTVAGCRNPVTAINPNGTGVGMPASGFAGSGFSSAGSGLNSGKVNVGNDDLGGFYDETRPSGSGTATADNGSPFGSAPANGGLGGGPPGGGSDGSGNGSGKEGESEKSGLSGFFQSAKGGIASLFGAAGNDKGNTVKKPDNKAFKNDVNGYRPKGNVRGMANASEVGGKNRDIWKTMNERYTDQYHTFITVENPSK